MAPPGRRGSSQPAITSNGLSSISCGWAVSWRPRSDALDNDAVPGPGPGRLPVSGQLPTGIRQPLAGLAPCVQLIAFLGVHVRDRSEHRVLASGDPRVRVVGLAAQLVAKNLDVGVRLVQA